MRTNTDRTLLTILFFCLAQICLAEAGEYYFKSFGLNEGLKSVYIKTIAHDVNGRIWFGTKDGGIGIYDFNSMETYTHRDCPDILRSDDINFIFQGKDGGMWIGTSIGLVRYDFENRQFESVRHSGEEGQFLNYLETDQGIYFGMDANLAFYSYQEKKLKIILLKEVVGAQISGMVKLDNHNLLLGTRGKGLIEYNPERNMTRQIRLNGRQHILYLFKDRQGHIWLNTNRKELYCHDMPSMKTLYHFTVAPNALNNGLVLSMVQKGDRIYIGTDGGGINIFDLYTETFSYVTHDNNVGNSIPSNAICFLGLDPQNHLWMGTTRSGAVCMKEVTARIYQEVSTAGKTGLSNSAVLCLYEDEDKTIWIGTDGGGMDKFNPRRQSFEHITSTGNKVIKEIIRLSDHELLLSTYFYGLLVYDKSTGKTREFEENAKVTPPGVNIIARLAMAGKDMINIFGYFPRYYNISTKQSGDIKSNDCTDLLYQNLIHSDSCFTFTFGNKAINVIDNSSHVATTIWNDTEPDETIKSAIRIKNGDILFSTNKNVYYLKNDEKNARKLNTVFKKITNLTYDADRDRIWLVNDNHLYRYDLFNKSLSMLNESDGVSAYQYLRSAALITEDGCYFGTTSGLLFIGHDMAFSEDAKMVFNVSNHIGKELRLAHNHHPVSFIINFKTQSVFDKPLYRYSLNNGEVPIEIDGNKILMHTLKSGKYELKISYMQRNGIWSEPCTIMKIRVSPPWWRNPLFVFGMIVILLLIGVFIIWMIYEKAKNKFEIAKKDSEKKTQKRIIDSMINISHELRTPLTMIYAPVRSLLTQGDFDMKTERTLRSVLRQSLKMKNVIDMIMETEKMTEGQFGMNVHPHAFKKWLSEIIENFEVGTSTRNIRIIAERMDDPGQVDFDPVRMEMVFSNLIINAFKYSIPDSQIKIALLACPCRQEISISISNQIEDSSEIEVNKIFSKWYIGRNIEVGSGIGLSFTQKIIEEHNGKINASIRNNTFTITLTLPIHNAGENELSVTEQTKESMIPFSKGIEEEVIRPYSWPVAAKSTVLIIEDDHDMLTYLKEQAMSKFNKVLLADDGENGFVLAKKELPDIVVCDVVMPRIDGFKLCNLIKENEKTKHIPVILLTGLDRPGNELSGYKTGANAYVTKPFDIETLFTILENNLKNQDMMRDRYSNVDYHRITDTEILNSKEKDFLYLLDKTISENIDNERMSVTFLADKLSISRSALYKRMREAGNVKIVDYINKRRLEAARDLVVKTKLSMKEVAFRIGFRDQQYFSSSFRKAFGLPPMKYRKQNSRE